MSLRKRRVPGGTISPNFSWAELTRGCDERAFSDFVYANLMVLAPDVLQPLREAFGAPIRITSGWRDPMKNASVGGHPRSSHMDGRAADITAYNDIGDLPRLWQALLDSDLPFDKAAYYAHRHFIHINIALPEREPRRLVYDVEAGTNRWYNRRKLE